MSTIPLAKGFSEKHLKFPVLLSRKIDGVPVRIDIDADGNHTIRTRQGKDVPAIRALVQRFVDAYIDPDNEFGVPISFVGEVHQRSNPDADFKETSGIIRRQYDQSEQLELSLFECSSEVGETFIERHQWMHDMIGGGGYGVSVVYQHYVDDIEQLEVHFDQFCAYYPKAEGMVARNWNDPFLPGKRSWGYQKLLREPTIDLRIVSVEEAIDKDGSPKGMAGRLVAAYKGTEIGIGPGRLTHAERIELWNNRHLQTLGQGSNGCPIAQIKYKADDSYDALRQPTFQFWRPEKDTPDA